MKQEIAPARPVRILAISDRIEESFYGPLLNERYGDADLVISCGDLPAEYLDFVASSVNAPLFGVRGNHDCPPDHVVVAHDAAIPGGLNLHGRVLRVAGLTLAGLEGSLRYNRSGCQYSETEMRLLIARMTPHLLWNRLRYGRYLDIFVTHAPPRGIQDADDPAHRGFAAFRDFLTRFRPRYHLHGHVHIYDPRTETKTRFHETVVLNVYGHREVMISNDELR
ncbi:MAG TPA: metallophosphoesterase [Thermomicrobiales bacterium]|nr:metallophosphoesterase [Thermomicrobiales bacterium]